MTDERNTAIEELTIEEMETVIAPGLTLSE